MAYSDFVERQIAEAKRKDAEQKAFINNLKSKAQPERKFEEDSRGEYRNLIPERKLKEGIYHSKKGIRKKSKELFKGFKKPIFKGTKAKLSNLREIAGVPNFLFGK